VYEGITGCESFAPWLSRLQDRMTERVIASILQLPPEWYDDDMDTLLELADRLYQPKKGFFTEY
jgi:hypothetical protein